MSIHFLTEDDFKIKFYHTDKVILTKIKLNNNAALNLTHKCKRYISADKE